MVNPAKYASSNEMQKCAVSIIIKEFAKDLKSISGICMDIGCGPGDITNNILLPSLETNAVIIGTDIHMAMIEYAKKMYRHSTRLKFEILDIQTKNLPEKYISGFNHIFSFFIVQWCYEIRKVFENIYCMLQSGGTMLVLFPIAHHIIIEVVKNIAHDSRFAPYLQNLNKCISPFYNSALPKDENLKDLLESIGFNVQHCSLREIDFSEINADTFLTSCISVCTFLDVIPPELKEEFDVEFRREYKNYKIKLDGKDCDMKALILDMHKLLVCLCTKRYL